MKLSSPAFGNGEEIPSIYTCEGRDIVPPLRISDVPGNAKSLALVCEDPDAPSGIFVHWALWNMDPATKEIKEGSSPAGTTGKSDFGRTGYGGPCPPRGRGPHRYFFRLYALDSLLPLRSGSRDDLESAMEGHVLARAELMGTFRRD